MNCPACGSGFVTVEPGPDVAPLSRVADAVLKAERGDAIRVSRDCWDCGWGETRALELVSVESEPGDPSVQRRRQLIEAVNTELEAIKTSDSLRDALAEIERIRRSDASNPEEE